MKQSAILLAVVLAFAASASALIHDNDHYYAWADPFGDMYDNYAEVRRGESIRLNIFVNDLNGASWECAADTAYTGIWWDSAVVDWETVHWDSLGIDVDDDGSEDIPNYYKAYWGFMSIDAKGAHYYNLRYDGSGGNVRWVAENRLIISMNMTIREDAPLGSTGIGLLQQFYWNFPYNPWVDPFFVDQIESDDPLWGMELNILPVAPTFDPGDFDRDGDVDADDIDDLCANMTGEGVPPIDPKYDLDGDNDTDSADMDILIHDLVETAVGVGTEYADFNLDGEVNTTDLTILATNFGIGSTWAEGNANCDTDVNTTDLTILATNFGFIAAGAVPEPATLFVMGCGAIGLLRRCRSKIRRGGRA